MDSRKWVRERVSRPGHVRDAGWRWGASKRRHGHCHSVARISKIEDRVPGNEPDLTVPDRAAGSGSCFHAFQIQDPKSVGIREIRVSLMLSCFPDWIPLSVTPPGFGRC
jgi:hypothetical protein